MKYTKIKKRLDELVKKAVSKRDKDICQKCGKYVEGSNRHRSHVVPVSAGNKLRWDINNLKILCYHCHINYWHKNPLDAAEWFKKKFPERWEYLEKHKGLVKFTEQDLILIEYDLKRLLEKEG